MLNMKHMDEVSMNRIQHYMLALRLSMRMAGLSIAGLM